MKKWGGGTKDLKKTVYNTSTPQRKDIGMVSKPILSREMQVKMMRCPPAWLKLNSLVAPNFNRDVEDGNHIRCTEGLNGTTS